MKLNCLHCDAELDVEGEGWLEPFDCPACQSRNEPLARPRLGERAITLKHTPPVYDLASLRAQKQSVVSKWQDYKPILIVIGIGYVLAAAWMVYTGNGADLVGLLVMMLCAPFAAGLYFAPTLIAARDKHRQTAAIFALNLLFGWTFVGWGVALVWAFTK